MEGDGGWLTRLWPRVPAAVADDLALLRVARLKVVVPILYATLIAVVLTAMLAANREAHWAIRYGMPLAAVAISAMRMAHWLRPSAAPVSAQAAHRLVGRLYAIAVPIAALCGTWAAVSWWLSEPGQRSYYPMFMALGTLTTAFCLASVRGATLAVLAAGIAPVIAALLLAGNRMDQIAAAIVLLATAFLARLILDQHDQQVEMLTLRHRLQRQAMTDPLTGLANRRALHRAAEEHFALGGAGPALILLDLDGFKPVNDRHGHAAGDALLIAIGGRLRAHAGESATVARIGGDEFAILLPACDAESLAMRASAMLAALAAPFPIDGRPIRIGATAGLARAPDDGGALLELLRSADAALYAAKPRRDASEAVAVSALPSAAAARPRRSRAMRR
ncbi:diguanylate cyclase [Sphingopyxis sp. PET50]|uniref:GGDEF domain-containing protein n=1 Tax=Sphingopyxis sp. PET50 TaxID=2976533 RepID=UPI0021AEC0B2|nr:diguanylate cyclase [Sphingopyxis sp. PET50]